MTTRTVRPAGPADVVALVELRRLMFEEMGTPGVERPAWQGAAGRWFRAALDDEDVRVVVAEVDGEVVASAMGQVRRGCPGPVTPTGRDALISNVVTAPGRRRQGHARACLEELVTRLHEVGVDRLELVASDDGRELYERSGFTAVAYPLMRTAGRASARR